MRLKTETGSNKAREKNVSTNAIHMRNSRAPLLQSSPQTSFRQSLFRVNMRTPAGPSRAGPSQQQQHGGSLKERACVCSRRSHTASLSCITPTRWGKGCAVSQARGERASARTFGPALAARALRMQKDVRSHSLKQARGKGKDTGHRGANCKLRKPGCSVLGAT